MKIKMVLRNLLKDITLYGEETTKDDAKIRESMGNHYFIDNPAKNLNQNGFIDSIKQGDYDLENYGLKSDSLAEYVLAIDSREQKILDGEKSFVYTYPNRIFCQEHKGNITNQFNIMISRLRKNLGSNRSVATIYSPFLDYKNEDIPCLNWLQATVRHNELTLHCMFRSNDIYGAWYANMLFLTYLGLKLTDVLNGYVDENITFKGIDYHSTSAHIYEINIPEAMALYNEV